MLRKAMAATTIGSGIVFGCFFMAMAVSRGTVHQALNVIAGLAAVCTLFATLVAGSAWVRQVTHRPGRVQAQPVPRPAAIPERFRADLEREPDQPMGSPR